jgi:hypothetical protein
MKKRYQIDQQQAVQQFRRLATEQNPNIQMILPMADIVGLLQEGVGNLLLVRHAVSHEALKVRRNQEQPDRRASHQRGATDHGCNHQQSREAFRL